MSESERITELERRLAKAESALTALAATFQRIAELIKGIGTKAADAAENLKQ